MYLCVHTHTYLHIHRYTIATCFFYTHTHTHTHTYTHTYTHTHIHTHTHAHTHTYTHTHTHTHIHTHTHAHTHIYTHTYTHTHPNTQVYDSDIQNGLVFELNENEEDPGAAQAANLAPRPDFENLMAIMPLDRELLTRILADLLKFQDKDLDNGALQLMLRIYGQRDEMVLAVHRTDLLVDQTGVHLYFEHKAIMAEV